MKLPELRRLYRRVCYERFRTGLTFKKVRLMLCTEADKLRENENHYMFVTRATVLGRWYQIKQSMFRTEHTEFFEDHIPLPSRREMMNVILRKESYSHAYRSSRSCESDLIF